MGECGSDDSHVAGAERGVRLFRASTAQHGLWFRQRPSNGVAASEHRELQGEAAPVWVRLVRQGSVVTSYGSVNGTTWTQIGSVTLSFGTSAYVGLAVTSHDATVRTARRSLQRDGDDADE